MRIEILIFVNSLLQTEIGLFSVEQSINNFRHRGSTSIELLRAQTEMQNKHGCTVTRASDQNVLGTRYAGRLYVCVCV